LDETITEARAKLKELQEKEAKEPPNVCGFRLQQRVFHRTEGAGTIVRFHQGDPEVKFDRQEQTTVFCDGGRNMLSHEPIKEPPALPTGQRVRHARYGFGTVTEAEGQTLTINFDTFGQKMILAAFVAIEPMAEAAE
jgi:hypothetical protein